MFGMRRVSKKNGNELRAVLLTRCAVVVQSKVVISHKQFVAGEGRNDRNLHCYPCNQKGATATNVATIYLNRTREAQHQIPASSMDFLGYF
jgi:hypothetical protein